MISTEQARRLGAICRKEATPQTLEELCCYNAYNLRMLGYDMIGIIDEMDPKILDMDALQLKHFILGIAFAEKKIIEATDEFDMEIEEGNETIH